FPHRPLHLLRPHPAKAQVPRRARRTAVRQRLLVQAIVAGDARSATMIGQRDVAVRTVPDVAAVAALDEASVPATIQQQDRLLSFADAGPDAVHEVGAQDPRAGEGRATFVAEPLTLDA